VYFEQTTDTFKCSPSTVKRSGGLSCNWTSTCLTRVEQGFMGFYLAWDLHRRPHYMLSRSKRKEAINMSKGKNVPFHGIPATKSHFNFGDICVVNYGTMEWNQLIDDSMIKQLNLEPLCNFMLNKIAVDTLKNGTSRENKDGGDRGNVSHAVGFSHLNIKLSNKVVTSPMMLADTQKSDVSRMVALSHIVRKFNKLFCPNETTPFSGHKERQHEFAQELCQTFDVEGENVIEQATWAITSVGCAKGGKEITFGCHIDKSNCACINYNIVCCFYYHFKKEEIWYRLALIGYSRKATQGTESTLVIP